MERLQAKDETGQSRALALRRSVKDGLVFAFVAIASAACIFLLAVVLHDPTHAIEPRASTAQLEAAEDTSLPDAMSNRCSSEVPGTSD